MIPALRHQKWITTGCLIWGLAFYADGRMVQPYGMYGILISSVITTIGLYYWIKYYRKKNQKFPSLKGIFKNMLFIGGTFRIRTGYLFSHLLEFWTGCILISMVMVGFMFIFLRESPAFAAAMRYASLNKEIIQSTGGVKGFGVLMGGKISGSHADLNFSIIGTTNSVRATSIIKRNKKGEWNVESLSIY